MDDVPLSLFEMQKGYRRTIRDPPVCDPVRGGSGRIMLRVCRNIWIAATGKTGTIALKVRSPPRAAIRGSLKPSTCRLQPTAQAVESPGGISPPGAPRTVHDPLESHGSRCSAVA
jgi:hypothetical protein